MCRIIKKINSEIRAAFLLIGIIALAIGLSERKAKESINKHGYQSHEFDDIW
ncbi:MAG: hypothetical protein PHS19_04405 [Eubacteriales bacterium]|nr:hypothetical protein [Eubacteriales bacterium]